MKQSEYLAEKRAALKAAQLEVDNAERVHNSTFRETIEQLNDLRHEQQRVSDRMDKRRREIASKFSEDPEFYSHGNLEAFRPEIRKAMDRFKPESDPSYRGSFYSSRAESALWDRFNEDMNADVLMGQLVTEDRNIDNRMDALRTKAYSDSRRRIEELKSSVSWLRNHIDYMEARGVFQQFAKEQKQREREKAANAIRDKAVAEFMAWVEANIVNKKARYTAPSLSANMDETDDVSPYDETGAD
jgi:uncharacterized coiled-coil DUF342 family protein